MSHRSCHREAVTFFTKIWNSQNYFVFLQVKKIENISNA
jgi:hypothetical protein